MADDVTSVLCAARHLIEDGWAKGSYETLDHRFCMIGALRKSALGRTDFVDPSHPGFAAYRAARDKLQLIVGQPIGSWNDAPSRKKHEVLQLFSEAIDERKVRT